jgi:hypothetical protein
MNGTGGHREALQLDNVEPALRDRVAARLRGAGVVVTDDGHDLFVTTEDLPAALRVALDETGRQRARRRRLAMLAGAGAAVVALVVGAGVFLARPQNGTQGDVEPAAALAPTQGSASCVDPVGDQIAGAVQAPRPAVRAGSADVVGASLAISGDTVELTATFVEPPVLPGTAIYSGAQTATSAEFKLYIDADRWYSVTAYADTPAPGVEAYHGDPDDPDDTFKDLNPPQDATWEGNSLTVRIPLDLLAQLPETFNWSLLTLVFEDIPDTGDMATGASPAMDQCGTADPVPAPSEGTPGHLLRFPGTGTAPTVPDDDPSAAAPTPPSTTTSVPPPVEQLDRSSQVAVASHLIDAWNSNDGTAAAEVAPPEVVEFLFAESRNTTAELSGCRHSSEIGPDEFQVLATFVCEGSFGADWASDQSIEVYVDGGASGGYEVTAVSFNRNPPGWRPID